MRYLIVALTIGASPAAAQVRLLQVLQLWAGASDVARDPGDGGWRGGPRLEG